MAAIADIKTSSLLTRALLATSSATVSVDKTWSPQGFVLPGVAKWVDRSGGIPIGYPAFTLSNRSPSKASRLFKVTAKVAIPTLEQTSASTSTGIQPAPTKAYDCTCIMEFLLPERSTATERNVLFSHVMSLLASSIAASDGSPNDGTGTPLYDCVVSLDQPF